MDLLDPRALPDDKDELTEMLGAKLNLISDNSHKGQTLHILAKLLGMGGGLPTAPDTVDLVRSSGSVVNATNAKQADIDSDMLFDYQTVASQNWNPLFPIRIQDYEELAQACIENGKLVLRYSDDYTKTIKTTTVDLVSGHTHVVTNHTAFANDEECPLITYKYNSTSGEIELGLFDTDITDTGNFDPTGVVKKAITLSTGMEPDSDFMVKVTAVDRDCYAVAIYDSWDSKVHVVKYDGGTVTQVTVAETDLNGYFDVGMFDLLGVTTGARKKGFFVITTGGNDGGGIFTLPCNTTTGAITKGSEIAVPVDYAYYGGQAALAVYEHSSTSGDQFIYFMFGNCEKFYGDDTDVLYQQTIVTLNSDGTLQTTQSFNQGNMPTSMKYLVDQGVQFRSGVLVNFQGETEPEARVMFIDQTGGGMFGWNPHTDELDLFFQLPAIAIKKLRGRRNAWLHQVIGDGTYGYMVRESAYGYEVPTDLCAYFTDDDMVSIRVADTEGTPYPTKENYVSTIAAAHVNPVSEVTTKDIMVGSGKAVFAIQDNSTITIPKEVDVGSEYLIIRKAIADGFDSRYTDGSSKDSALSSNLIVEQQGSGSTEVKFVAWVKADSDHTLYRGATHLLKTEDGWKVTYLL